MAGILMAGILMACILMAGTLMASPHCMQVGGAALETLSLTNARAGVSGARALAEALGRGGQALRALRLRRCGLLKADLRPIIRGIESGARSLTELSLAHNRLAAAGASALAAWLERAPSNGCVLMTSLIAC